MQINQPIRILHLVGDREDAGGVLSVLRNLDSVSDANTCEHVVWVNRAYRETRQPSLTYRFSDSVLAESSRHFDLLKQAIPASRELTQLCQEETFDIVHAHSRGTLLVAILYAWKTGRPVIYTNHNYARGTRLYRWAAQRPKMYSVVLTQNMARHYGLDPVTLGLEDPVFARVDLGGTTFPQADLGVLRHASILLATSNPTRTSPVKRGKWVMESLLDCPPPPAPPGAPQLPDPDDDRTEAASLRRMLEIHRQDPDCASCHVRMDAIGFALEPLDAVGRWRTVSDGHPVDAAAVLPGGRRIDGPADLRDVIVEDPALLRSFGKHLMVYALGRGLEWRDEPVLDELVKVLQARPTVRAAIEFIVLDDTFRRMPGAE